MNNNHTIRNILPHKIPEKLWLSKDYSNIILYTLDVYGPMYQQEFVSRGSITDKIPEKTFYNHIKQLIKKGYLESEIDEESRRRMYSITTDGEKALKRNLTNNQESYGDLLSKIENVKYFEKKKIFDKQFERYLDLCDRVENKYLKKIVDLSHFYPQEKFSQYKELELKLNNEKTLKRDVLKKFNNFIKLLKDYKKVIDTDLLESEKEIFYTEEIEDYKFQCPRCNEKKIIDYGKTFECINCKLEFDKVSFKLIEDKEDILAEEDKKAFGNTFSDFFDEDKSNII